MFDVKEKLTKSEIKKLFTCAFTEEMNTGIEFERLAIHNDTYTAVDYYDGIGDFLREFAKSENWDYITDDYNIIGLKQEHDTITLEPGCQTELSLKPEKTIFDLEKKINSLNKLMMPILDKFGIKLLQYGVQPISTNKNINIIPKRRYHIMAKYLWGIFSDVMMRETAGVQGCFDFNSEDDAMRKFKIANMLSPFVTAMFANSPIRGGVETGYKTFRGLAWLYTDSERCGFACDFKDDMTFDDYIEKVLNSPVIYLNKNDENIPVDGKFNFNEYMNNGYEGFDADVNDFELHANLYFPDVRLRNFIEIRNHDCTKMPLSVVALYKGILYSEDALSDVENLLSEFSKNDFEELRYGVVKYALQTPCKNYYVSDYAKEILKISEKSLKLMNTGEEVFLEPITELTSQELCPADIILRNWNGIWNKNINKLIQYLY